MVKTVVTSIFLLFVRGRATPASHSWKWAMTAFDFSWQTNCGCVSLALVKEKEDEGLGSKVSSKGLRTSPRNQATRYPKTIASLVSWSSGGEGMPATFHKSLFHSSSHL